MSVENDKENETPKKSTENPTNLQKLNEYSNLIVGVATVLLVIVTAIYIALSMKIANETKRLADITVEQFKIRSYPTFLITRGPPTYEDAKYKDQIKIANYGEISSFETSFAIFYAGQILNDENKPEFMFFLDWQSVYIDEDLGRLSVIDYSSKIRPKASKTIESFLPKDILDRLKYNLIIVRHKVPYDIIYRYEAFAYGLEKSKDEKTNQLILHWETLPDSKKKNLCENLFKSLIMADGKENTVRKFFVDYPSHKALIFTR